MQRSVAFRGPRAAPGDAGIAARKSGRERTSPAGIPRVISFRTAGRGGAIPAAGRASSRGAFEQTGGDRVDDERPTEADAVHMIFPSGIRSFRGGRLVDDHPHKAAEARASAVAGLDQPDGCLKMLDEMRTFGGERLTSGLSLEELEVFVRTDLMLATAIEDAVSEHRRLREKTGMCGAWCWHELLKQNEGDLIRAMGADFENFYADHALQPFVPLAARGPWIVTTHGAVLHDNGGYGMLGLGQNDPAVLEAIGRKQVMANIMTPSFAQANFGKMIRREVGHARAGGVCPYESFVCLNSGSEAVSFALRVSDIHAMKQTTGSGPHQGRKTVFVSLKGSFHGRTDGPAHVSDSCKQVYSSHLSSFNQLSQEEQPFTLTVTPNDVQDLEETFARIDRENLHVQAMLFEPVMGEGNPGVPITREFYDAARRLTKEHHSLLIVDSVQAGLRVQGVLSITDYPGFEDCEAPDFETWSKAINSGQFPLSVVGLSQSAASSYVRGLYGNSMTANPRALDVACAVLQQMTPSLRRNIRQRGAEIKEEFKKIQAEFPELVTGVTGTGLLVALHLHESAVAVVGPGGLEERCRRSGLGVIHGGKNALRFTPWFGITPEEIGLMCRTLRAVLAARSAEARQIRPLAAACAAQARARAVVGVVNSFLEPYLRTTPTAEAAMGFLLRREAEQSGNPRPSLHHDHLAFRTLALSGPMSGIDSAASVWEGLGYTRSEETLRFPGKKLRSKWFSPPRELREIVGGCPAPRVFISEVVLEDLQPEAQRIILKYVKPEEVTPEAASQAGTPWSLPTHEDYQRLSELNPAAAWTLLHGYTLNHTAVAGHWLSDPDISNLNTSLLDEGIALNPDGGYTKVSPDGLLLQSSSFSDSVQVAFADGQIHGVPGSYIEFVQRLVLLEYGNVPAKDRCEFQYRDGFEATSADRIFTSTNSVQ